MKPDAILVAVDFGEASARAVALAGTFAQRLGTVALTLLHAESLEVPPYFTAAQIDGLERQQQQRRVQVEEFLTRFGHQQTRAPFSTVISDRRPAEAILHEAHAADLVAMGTHGRHGPRRWWLGSVAERVLQELGRPLLVTHGAGEPHIESTFDRVLVHASAPLAGTRAMEYASTLAACCGGTAIDARQQEIEPALAAARATMLVVATPLPPSRVWLTHVGEPLVRANALPVLFVPETTQGAPS